MGFVQSGICKSIASVTSTGGMIGAGFLIYSHLLHYNIPKLQRSIIRILFITPIYALFSFLCLLIVAWVPLFGAIRDIWEAVAIYCFSELVLDYCGGENDCAQAIQQHPGVINHPWPCNYLFEKCFGASEIRLNATFLKNCKRGTLQFVAVKPIMAVATVTMFFLGLHESWTWLIFENAVYNVSYTVALYCLVLLYMATKDHPALAQSRALRKFATVKVIIFATFWQSLVISLISSMSRADRLAWSAFILCLEIPVFALLQWWAFPSSEFRNASLPAVTPHIPKHVEMNMTLDDVESDIPLPPPPPVGPPSIGLPASERERRKVAAANLTDVVAVSDVMKDAYYNFSGKYGKHALLPEQEDVSATSATRLHGSTALENELPSSQHHKL